MKSNIHDDQGYNTKGMAESATKNVMQEYLNNDQLNLLPKPIMNTNLLRQMKNNRELPIYGFKQSVNIVQQTAALKRIGDSSKSKTLEDVLEFKARLE